MSRNSTTVSLLEKAQGSTILFRTFSSVFSNILARNPCLSLTNSLVYGSSINSNTGTILIIITGPSIVFSKSYSLLSDLCLFYWDLGVIPLWSQYDKNTFPVINDRVKNFNIGTASNIKRGPSKNCSFQSIKSLLLSI